MDRGLKDQPDTEGASARSLVVTAELSIELACRPFHEEDVLSLGAIDGGPDGALVLLGASIELGGGKVAMTANAQCRHRTPAVCPPGELVERSSLLLLSWPVELVVATFHDFIPARAQRGYMLTLILSTTVEHPTIRSARFLASVVPLTGSAPDLARPEEIIQRVLPWPFNQTQEPQ